MFNIVKQRRDRAVGWRRMILHQVELTEITAIIEITEITELTEISQFLVLGDLCEEASFL